MFFFLEKGLNFAQIGILVSFREIFINILEIPSGSFADLYGRRFSMVLSFSAYIISFLIFGFSNNLIPFFAAMFFFAIGDSFRTGTHKAIIFSWLRSQNRLDEKTKVYGYTRSWSKFGSAFSIIIATLIILFKNNYNDLFFYAAIPYAAGLINFITYPKSLDGERSKHFTLSVIINHFTSSLKKAIKNKPLRNLMYESMGYEGTFAALKDYIQPIVKSLIISLPILITLEESSRSAILIGVVYFILYLGSAYSSRFSHKISDLAGNEEKGTQLVWLISFIVYTSLIPLFYFKYYIFAIVLFILLHILQNFWRPMHISRFDSHSTEKEGAVILSIESQSKSFATAILAPIFGFLIDFSISFSIGGEFWLIAICASAISVFFYIRSAKRNRPGFNH
ncbi:MAG: MFS transporter [Melioribacteraceae bacterium]|nr:MFS transporter [Melioribacteraceae bacterium]